MSLDYTLLNEPTKLLQRLADAEAKLDDLQYRHECLKLLYSDEMNYLDDDQSVDDDIDTFIQMEKNDG